MEEKTTNVLKIINEVFKKHKPIFCFDYEKNNGNYNDIRIKYLYEKLPILITHINWILEEGKKFNDYYSSSLFPGTVNSKLPIQNNYLKQSIPENYNNFYETLIHEFAHTIDQSADYIVYNGTFGFSNAIDLITKEILKIPFIQCIPKNSLDYLNNEGFDINLEAYKTLNYYKYAGLLDILDALSNGSFYMNYLKNKRDITAVSNGHGEYFTDNETYKVSEIFADYIAMKIMCPNSINALALDFPDLVNAIEQTIDYMVQEVKKI